MDVTIQQSTVSGTARAPPSKSHSHRAILAAGYSSEVRIDEPLLSTDTWATAGAILALSCRSRRSRWPPTARRRSPAQNTSTWPFPSFSTCCSPSAPTCAVTRETRGPLGSGRHVSGPARSSVFGPVYDFADTFPVAVERPLTKSNRPAGCLPVVSSHTIPSSTLRPSAWKPRCSSTSISSRVTSTVSSFSSRSVHSPGPSLFMVIASSSSALLDWSPRSTIKRSPLRSVDDGHVERVVPPVASTAPDERRSNDASDAEDGSKGE